MNLPDFSTLDLTASLTPAQFDARLRRVGVTTTSSTIRRWASEGLVASPTGTTYAARWPLRAAGDVTLVFRLREGTPLQAATHDGLLHAFRTDRNPTITTKDLLTNGERLEVHGVAPAVREAVGDDDGR